MAFHDVDLHDDCGVRKAEQFGEQHAGLAETLVVALQAGEDQIELFVFDCGSQRTRGRQRIEFVELIVGNVDSAVGAFGQSFFDGLFGAVGTHGDGHDFAALFFFQAQGFFEREAVRLIRFEADVGFADPRAAFDDGERRILGGNLFDADSDFQESLLRSIRDT